MGNFETTESVKFNLKEVIKQQGLNIIESSYTKDTPASLYPICELKYVDEELGYNHKQKPLYNGINYRLKITTSNTNEQILQSDQAKWLHKIRDGVTINALNINNLSDSQLVSKVTTEKNDTDLSENGIGILEYDIQVRYREI